MFIAFEYCNFNYYRTLTYVKRFWILFVVLALYKFLIIIIIITAKLLGLTVSANLTWNAHIEEVVRKANKRFYVLVLKRAKLSLANLYLR